MFKINTYNKRLWVVDNFYQNPDKIRAFALKESYSDDNRFYKGMRTLKPYRHPDLKLVFEDIMSEEITDFEGNNNGCFQITSAENPRVWHCDGQKWAGMVYLTPDAPLRSGTRTHRSLRTGSRHADENLGDAFAMGNYDSTQFEIADDIANIYNRLVLFNARMIHSAGPYFGNHYTNGRLIQLFFFD